MSITLFEAAKLATLDPLSAAVQWEIARSSMVFRFLPFVEVSDFEFDSTYDTEEAESSFRGLNEELTEGEEDVAKLNFSVGIHGDKVQVDRVLHRVKGADRFAKKMAQKAFGVGVTYNNSFIKGDQANDPREFNGLQSIMEQQMPVSQTINGGTNGGDPLSLSTLDAVIDSVRNPNIIFCSASLARKFWAAGRDSSVAGFVNYQPNDNNPAGMGLGAAITFYNGIPIVSIKGPFNADNVLPYTEAAPVGGQLQTTSLYVARVGSDGLYGAQIGGVQANDFGNVQGSVFHKGDIEWVSGLGIDHPLSVARYNGITDAAIVS